MSAWLRPEDRLCARTGPLSSEPRIAPNDLWLYSEAQLARRCHPRVPCERSAWRAVRNIIRDCQQWVRARSAGGERHAWIPLTAAYLGVAAVPEIPGSDCGCSNGLAAGTSLQDAKERGLLELIERDAVAIWWYNRLDRPGLPLDVIRGAGGGDLVDWLVERSRRTHLLNLTSDLGVPVVAALSAEPKGHRLAYGFAAAATLGEAALQAALELLQIELSLHFIRLGGKHLPSARAGILMAWSERTSIQAHRHLNPQPTAPVQHDTEAVRDSYFGILERHGLDVWVFELTREDVGVPVVRMLVPGLRPWWPRFAQGRLYEVPLRLGLRSVPIQENELNSDPILI